MATEGTGAAAAAGPRSGLEDLAVGASSSPAREFVLADIDGLGRHPAHLADADRRLAQPDPAHVLGRRPAAGGRVPARRLLRPRLGRVRARSRRSPCASTRVGRSTATGRCRSARGRASRSPTRAPRSASLYYQIDYTLCDVPDDAARFCAQFRRVNPLPKGEVVTILDGVQGRGHYVGTYCSWGVNNSGWWGEGEVKFFLDGDGEFPTICGTGTEDYFCGSYNFDVGGQYAEFTTPYAGMPLVLRPDGTYRSQQRFSLYRWHLTDPIRFRSDLRVTMQALGWRRGRALPASCRTTSPPSPTGTRRCRSRRSRRCPTATRARSSDASGGQGACSSGQRPRANQWRRLSSWVRRPGGLVAVEQRPAVPVRPVGLGPVDEERPEADGRSGRHLAPAPPRRPGRPTGSTSLPAKASPSERVGPRALGGDCPGSPTGSRSRPSSRRGRSSSWRSRDASSATSSQYG